MEQQTRALFCAMQFIPWPTLRPPLV